MKRHIFSFILERDVENIGFEWTKLLFLIDFLSLITLLFWGKLKKNFIVSFCKIITDNYYFIIYKDKEDHLFGRSLGGGGGYLSFLWWPSWLSINANRCSISIYGHFSSIFKFLSWLQLWLWWYYMLSSCMPILGRYETYLNSYLNLSSYAIWGKLQCLNFVPKKNYILHNRPGDFSSNKFY